METVDKVRIQELLTVEQAEKTHVLVADCFYCKRAVKLERLKYRGPIAKLRYNLKCRDCGKFMAEILLLDLKSLRWNPRAPEAGDYVAHYIYQYGGSRGANGV